MGHNLPHPLPLIIFLNHKVTNVLELCLGFIPSHSHFVPWPSNGFAWDKKGKNRNFTKNFTAAGQIQEKKLFSKSPNSLPQLIPS
jgi:hypothetical protein